MKGVKVASLKSSGGNPRPRAVETLETDGRRETRLMDRGLLRGFSCAQTQHGKLGPKDTNKKSILLTRCPLTQQLTHMAGRKGN